MKISLYLIATHFSHLASLERPKINPQWPNALRWFLVQDLTSFTPWYFIQKPAEMKFAADAFRREDVAKGEVFVFASHQDCDDFAGLELVEGQFSEKVIYFHPVFGDSSQPSPRTWNIIIGTFVDVFDFVGQQIIPDMKEWSQVEDANDL